MVVKEKQWSFSEKEPLGYGRTLIAYAGSGPPRHSTSTYDGPGGVFTIAILKNHDQPFYNILYMIASNPRIMCRPISEDQSIRSHLTSFTGLLQIKFKSNSNLHLTILPCIGSAFVRNHHHYTGRNKIRLYVRILNYWPTERKTSTQIYLFIHET